MNLSTKEIGQPRQEPSNEQKAELLPSAQVSANANVMRRFSEDDLDNCWTYYKSYLIDILNGDYDLNEARNDLNGLIGTKFDNRVDIKPEQKSCSHDWKYKRDIRVKVCKICNYAENYIPNAQMAHNGRHLCRCGIGGTPAD